MLDGDFQGLALAVAEDFDGHGRAGLGFARGEPEAATVNNGLAVVFEHDVAVLEAGLVGGASWHDVADERAAGILEFEFFGQRGGDVLDHDAQVAAGDATVAYEAVHDVAGEVGGDGEADALVAAGAAEDGGVDADEAALNIHERAAGVAGVDGGVGLDEVFVVFDAEVAAAGGADDAGGDGLADAEGVADGEHDVAYLDLVAVGHGDDREVLGVNLDDGDVGLGVAANDFGGELAAILHCHFNLFGAIHDMVVGQDVTVFGDDDARAEAFLARDVEPAVGRLLALLVAKEAAPEGIIGAKAFRHRDVRRLRGYDDLHDAGGDLLHNGREAGVGAGSAREGAFVHLDIGRVGRRFGFSGIQVTGGEGGAGD